MIRTGIRSCSLGGRLDPDLLTRVRDAGFDALELSFNRGIDLDGHDRDHAAGIRAQADRLGMLLTAHAPEEAWLSDPDRDAAAAAAQRLSVVAGQVSRYGVRLLVLHTCPYRPAVPGKEKEQMASLCVALSSLAICAERHELRILVETMTRQSETFTCRLDNIIEALTRVNSRWLGICVDTNHLNTTEPLESGIRRAGKWIAECHCNDNHGVREEHLLPFDGEIDWPGFAAALAAVRFDGPLILEPSHYDERRFDNMLAAAAAAARQLRTSLAEAGEGGTGITDS